MKYGIRPYHSLIGQGQCWHFSPGVSSGPRSLRTLVSESLTGILKFSGPEAFSGQNATGRTEYSIARSGKPDLDLSHSARDVRVRLGLVALPFPSRASGDKIRGRYSSLCVWVNPCAAHGTDAGQTGDQQELEAHPGGLGYENF